MKDEEENVLGASKDQGKMTELYTKNATCERCGPVWLWFSHEVPGCSINDKHTAIAFRLQGWWKGYKEKGKRAQEKNRYKILIQSDKD